MALIKCKECSYEISNKAKVCPNCGIKNKSSIWKALLYLFIGFSTLGTLIQLSSENNPKATYKKSPKTLIKQKGYFKKSKLRYFTFQTNIKRDAIDDKLLKKLKAHGSKQPNTKGNVTASFYYLNTNSAPDITLAKNSQLANDIAHNHKPFLAVWIMPNQQVNMIRDPE